MLPTTVERLRAGIEADREIGVQLYASLEGRCVADVALGASDRGVAMTPDTLSLWISMSKPVMGIAYGQLIDRGLVDLDAPVSAHLPQFARLGKEGITPRHLLTHTAGFRNAARVWLAPPFWDVVEQICAAPQEEGWVAGRTSGYNVVAAWYVLAAILERIDGRNYRDYTREEIFAPLGMTDCWIGIPAERFRAYGSRVAVTHFRKDGRWATSDSWGTEAGCAVLRPGGNGHGPMREHARLYEMLLGDGERDGVRVLAPGTASLLTRRHSQGLRDRTFGSIYDRGLGFVIDSRRYHDGFGWFGPHASDASFGHQGFFASAAFADPVHGLVVALCWNGVREFDPVHDARVDETLDALYRDLDLVRG